MSLIKDITIYWINMNKSIDRHEYIINLFKTHDIKNHKRIEGIDGCELNICNYNIENNMTKNELGCVLSHIKAIKQAYLDLLENGKEYALICEDDISFDYLKYHNKNPIDLIKQDGNNYQCELLQLAICCRNEHNNIISKFQNNILLKGNRDCTTCYLIKKSGMEKIIAYSNNKNNIIKCADNLIYEIVNSSYTKPMFTYCNSSKFLSTIHKNTTYQRENTSKKFWDNYYLTNYYKTIILILDSDNESIYSFNREIWKKYMNINPSILCLFIRYENITEKYILNKETNTLYIKGSESSNGFDIYLKTLLAFKFINEKFYFDYVIRTNLSSFWIFDNLIKFIGERQTESIYGYKINTTINKYDISSGITTATKYDFISGTGIIIPNKILPICLNQLVKSIDELKKNFITNYDDIEISNLYNNSGILMRDGRRFCKFICLIEDNNIKLINDKINEKNNMTNSIVYYRVKSQNQRILYDKYILNNLLEKYYKVSVLNDKEKILLEKQIILNEKNFLNIFISKKTKSFNYTILNKIFHELNINNKKYTESSNFNESIDYDIIITNICERKEYYNSKSLNIIISGESICPSNIYDISISTITHFNSIKNIYYPYGYSSLFEHKKSTDNNQYLCKKTNFCAYMYYNQIPHRIEYFNLFNQYKHVDGLGKCCNNVDISNSRFIDNEEQNYNDIAVHIYSSYKFVLAIENNYIPGYFTEKIINPLIANSIPIYWGHPDVFNYINKLRVIYMCDFESNEKLLEYIKWLDSNDEEYEKITSNNFFVKGMEPSNIEKILNNVVFN